MAPRSSCWRHLPKRQILNDSCGFLGQSAKSLTLCWGFNPNRRKSFIFHWVLDANAKSSTNLKILSTKRLTIDNSLGFWPCHGRIWPDRVRPESVFHVFGGFGFLVHGLSHFRSLSLALAHASGHSLSLSVCVSASSIFTVTLDSSPSSIQDSEKCMHTHPRVTRETCYPNVGSSLSTSPLRG